MTDNNEEEEWEMGWTEEEEQGEEKYGKDNHPNNHPPESPGRPKLDNGPKLRSGSTTSMNSVSKFIDPKQAAIHVGSQSLAKGITSSPSFQELERAIGATLALSLNAEQQQDQQAQDGSSPSVSKSGSREWGNNNNSSKGGGVGFNITQQKLQAQRLKQQQQYRQQQNQYPSSYSPRHYATNRGGAQSPQTVMTVATNARQELGHFVNESDSRAIILFHSPMLSPIAVRDACQKYGVLYYIRPEFHGKGVTLLSYFDLRCAIHAHGSVVEELGPGAEASSHYSVMLHAANNNSEEFRLEAKNLPKGFLETDVESIFSRYGQLRSIQKMFGTDEDSAQERDNAEGTMEASAFKVEYFNIQDARLAASELCATSAQLLGPDATVSFAPLDSRKQQLCRQLLATLSRWRSELAPAMSLQVAHHHHPHGLGSISPVHGMGGPYSPSNAHGGGTLSPSTSFGMLPMGHMAPINGGTVPAIGHDLQQSSFPGMYGGPVGMSAVNNVMSSSSSSLIIDQGGNGVGVGQQHHHYPVSSGGIPMQHHMQQQHSAGGHAGGMQQMQVNPYGVGANFPEVAMQQQMGGHNPYSHSQLQQLQQQHPGGHPFNNGGMNNGNIDGGGSGDVGQRMVSSNGSMAMAGGLVSNSNDIHRHNNSNSNDGSNAGNMNGSKNIGDDGGGGHVYGAPVPRDSRGQGSSDPSQQQQWGGGGAPGSTIPINGNNNNQMTMMNNGNAQGVFPQGNNGLPMGMGVYLNNTQQHQQQQHYTYGASHHTAAAYHQQQQQQQQHSKGGQPMSQQQQQQAPYGYHQPQQQQQHQQQQQQQQSGGPHNTIHGNGGQGQQQQQHRALPHHHNGGHTYGGPGSSGSSSSAGATLAGPGGAGGRRGPSGPQGRGGQQPLGMMPQQQQQQVPGHASLQGSGQQQQQQQRQQHGAAMFAGSGGMMQHMGSPQQQQQQQQHPGGRSDSPSGASMMGSGSSNGSSGGGDQSNGVDFSLDLSRVKDGEDVRTTVMVSGQSLILIN